MENNLRYLEIAWAAQRSGLYYTAVNSHLRPGEVQYILDDCGALAIVDFVRPWHRRSSHSTSRGCEFGFVWAATCRVSHSYESSTASQPPVPVADECEGREMLYSSGTTGRPKGVQKQLPLTPLGDISAAPVLIASRMALSGAGPGAVYLSPAPLYHSAPLVYCMSMTRLGAAVVVMERFDATRCLELIAEHRCHSCPVRPDDVHSAAGASARRTAALRRFEPEVRGARSSSLPGRGEETDARLVGSDHPRVLRRH